MPKDVVIDSALASDSCTGCRNFTIAHEAAHQILADLFPNDYGKAVKRVKRNKGVVGVDKMIVYEIDTYFQNNKERIKKEILEKKYRPQPIATGELKLPISGYVHMMKAFERMVCEAAVTGNRDLAVTALNMDLLCQIDHDANIVIDELIEAHKDYLPQFKQS